MTNYLLSLEDALNDRASFEVNSSRASKAVYIGDGIALCKVANRFKMYVPVQDLSLAPHLMLEGYWESWISVAYYRLLKHIMPSTIINVGANLGYYAFLGSALLPNAKVIAYEPQPDLANLMRRSSLINGFSNLLIHQKALGETPGSAWLRRFDDFLGSATLTSNSSSIGSNAVAVEVGCLDLESHDPIEFLLIDAEGYEFEILKGAQKRITNSNSLVIMMEFSACRYPNKHEFIDWISAYGFGTYKITYEGQIEKIDFDDLHRLEIVIDLVIIKGLSENSLTTSILST